MAAHALDARVTGELSLSGTVLEGEWSDSRASALYIPELYLEQALGATHRLDATAALRASALYTVGTPEEFDDDLDLAVYRLWLRHTTDQSELRLGRQRISFGSAYLLRPLMWFDAVDPRDPLQLTEGVDGLMGRYFFANNANVWLWGLYGNEDPKGWEMLPTVDDRLEYGGRAQVPLPAGELGLSVHHRTVDATATGLPVAETAVSGESMASGDARYPESRGGLDGRWDLEVGFWLEGVLIYRDMDFAARYQRLLTLGADYTFAWGNGVHLLAEHLISETAEGAWRSGDGYAVTAATADYPVGLNDRMAAFVYYDWELHRWSPLARWTHSFAAWTVHVVGFWNEEDDQTIGTGSDPRYAGSGVQILAVWNH